MGLLDVPLHRGQPTESTFHAKLSLTTKENSSIRRSPRAAHMPHKMLRREHIGGDEQSRWSVSHRGSSRRLTPASTTIRLRIAQDCQGKPRFVVAHKVSRLSCQERRQSLVSSTRGLASTAIAPTILGMNTHALTCSINIGQWHEHCVGFHCEHHHRDANGPWT